jgi:chaperone modulatory protein CbpM
MASSTPVLRRGQLVRTVPSLLTVEALARESGLHPEVVRRLLALGLLDSQAGPSAAPLFRPQDVPLLRRAVRLRGDLGLNYAGAVLASELLVRIEELEHRPPAGAPTDSHHEVIAWTRIV